MPKRSAHFNQGKLSTAFVFSAPGAKEEEAQCPVVGATGDNLSWALQDLVNNDSKRFPSTNRYDYRLTNAFVHPLSKGADGRTEASKAEILNPANIARVKRDLAGCDVVILCGARAGFLLEHLKDLPSTVVEASHTSNQALVAKHNLAGKKGKTPNERRRLRAGDWAQHVYSRLEKI